MPKRFVVEKEEGSFGSEVIIITDKQTGVQYLSYRNGSSGGITPLLDEQGKPIIKK